MSIVGFVWLVVAFSCLALVCSVTAIFRRGGFASDQSFSLMDFVQLLSTIASLASAVCFLVLI